MKNLFITITFLLLATFSFAGNLWQLSPEKKIATFGEQKLFPNEYILAKFAITDFVYFQSQIPKEEEGNFPIIELPKPNGEFGSYYIFEVPMMAEGLANRYPMIKTYTLIDTQNPTITGKADITMWGFHAKIFDSKNTYFIDPYKRDNTEWYLVYYKKDYSIPAGEHMQCLVEDDLEINEIQAGEIIKNNQLPTLTTKRKTFGTDKRTYRLALACTQEYAAAVGGTTPTKATVLAAMVTTMNRVNGVFEREFSMQAQLIANTDDVIYLPGAADPYTNGSGSTMLGENNTTLNAVIGSSNFDFGHVFSTGGGGIANLACVCRNSKARGVTGRPNPVGDPFDIDFVAHEMGHQFGGSHTFNSISGSCSGNGSSSSSYEPGSATTIMGYAGICSGDNVQNNSDDYYHTRSLLQMSAHMEGLGDCAAKVSTNNTPPAVASINKTYNIPYQTPFELEASATDLENNPITYCWEQWDLGSYAAWDVTSATNPLFRSFDPTTNGIRYFPIMSKIYTEQIKTRGEVLPEVSRNVSFKVAVRDINNGNGSFNFSDNELEIQAHSTGTNLYRVTSHDVIGQTWTGDQSQTVTWNTAGTESGTINTPTVDIYFSLDKGVTWPHLMAAGVPNNGTAIVYAPNLATTFGLIKVKGHNNIFFDVNNKYIEIVPQVYPASINDIAIQKITIYPNPASDVLRIENLPIGINHIQLLTTNGQLIKEFTVSQKLDIHDISNGLYFLKVVDGQNNSAIRKVLIQK